MTISEADFRAALSEALAEADEIERTHEQLGFRLTRSDIRLLVLVRELRKPFTERELKLGRKDLP